MNIDQAVSSAGSTFPLGTAIVRSFAWSITANGLFTAVLAGLFFCIGGVGIYVVVQVIGGVGYSLLCTACGSDSSGALIPWSFVVSFALSTLAVASLRFVHLYFLHDLNRELARTA